MSGLLRTERFPTPWCAGCGLNALLMHTANTLQKLGFNKTNAAVVSGIGCTARASGFIDLDGVNGLHGRAIPLAEGIKLANPALKVVVISGDGDLAGIGGNHLLHSSRRNTDITVLCSVNETYGMTGGQTSPLTKKGVKTLTSPNGAPYNQMNLHGLFVANKNYFYARTTVAHPAHMVMCIEAALKYPGFSFVEVLNPCYTNLGSRIGYKSLADMLLALKNDYHIVEGATRLADNELGVIEHTEK
jgi:2-oxoglutarate ferredoxin oxidoreductase subunit beta